MNTDTYIMRLLAQQADQRKPWLNFLNKLSEYQNLPTEYWSEYHLLGWWCDLTRMPLDDSGRPSDHPQVKQMRALMWQLVDSEYCHTKSPPNYYKADQVMDYLTWAWQRMQNVNLPCHSLSIITGDRSTFLYEYQKSRQTDNINLDPSRLDLGD